MLTFVPHKISEDYKIVEFYRVNKDLSYWNEKYYRNGFGDGVQITIGCIKA